MLPLAIFGIVLTLLVVEQTRATFKDGVQQRVAAISVAVDATIDGTIDTLQALGAALEVDASDYLAFRAVAERILRTQPDWSNINLALASGQQVVNLQRPQGSQLHSIAGVDDSIEIINRTRGPVINNLGFGTATKAWDIAVRVPIIRGGEIRYILTGVVKPEAIAQAVAAQNIPEGWSAYVIDGNGRVIAALADGETRAAPGDPAPEPLRSALENAAAWTPFTDDDAHERYLAVRGTDLTGWTVALNIPASAAHAIAARTAWIIGIALLAAIAAAFAFSYLLGRRRLLKPIEALAQDAAAIRSGGTPHIAEVRGLTELSALSGVLHDAVDAMHEREQLARREAEALAAADRAKTEFIAMLSHELRNPLSALTSAAHLLKVAGASARTMSEVQPIIQRQTEHMSRLVEDLLDISRVTMGKANLEMETLELGALARGLVTTWRAAGRLDRHAVFAETDEVWVRADRARMEQILSNLLHNALKFTPEGKSIWVRVAAGKGDALLEVRDQGEGLSPELARQAFDLFTQGQTRLDRRRGGLGIGLALVKRLVEMHSGTVEAQSPGPGKGSTFRVRLPAVAASRSTERRRPMTGGRAAKPLRVLVVEDNDDAREMVTATLAHAGHEVCEARDGASALAMAAEHDPDAVVLDIGLPDISGYDVARRLRSSEGARHSLLIALTGYGQKEDKDRAKESGFDVHLTKPVSPETLQRALRAAA